MSHWMSDLGADPELEERRKRSSRIPDLIFGAILPMGALDFANVPINEVTAILMVGLALMRKPRFRLPALAVVLLVALWGGLALSSQVNGLPFPVRRMAHMATWVGIVIAVGQGRVNLMSMARGVALGILIGVPLSIPSIVTGAYTGRMTGVFGDPNGAGMALVTIGPWAVGIVSQRLRIPVALFLGAAIFLTYSRTSLLAMGVVVVWVFLSRRFSVWLAIAVLIPIALYTTTWLETLRLWGPFEDRSGSDLLRERIAEAATEKLAVTPWYGNGPGTATVVVQKMTFFLHNSYDAVRLEGGWLALVLVMTLTVLAFVRAATGAQDQRHPWFEASLGAALVCALSLGEVIFELQFAANLGALLLVGSVQRNLGAVNDGGMFDRTGLERFTDSVTDDSFIAKLQNAPSRILQRTPSTLDEDTGGPGLLDGPGDDQAGRVTLWRAPAGPAEQD